MAIDVRQVGGGRITGTRTQKATNSGKAKKSEGTASVAGDKVEITPKAAAMEAMIAKLAAMPDIDEARVAEVRESVDDGSYQVVPERLAHRMLDFEASLGDYI